MGLVVTVLVGAVLLLGTVLILRALFARRLSEDDAEIPSFYSADESRRAFLKRPIRFALGGAGFALGAGIVFVFVFGDGLLRASAFMIGLAAIPVVLGVLLDSCLDHLSIMRGRMTRLRRVLDRSQLRFGQRTRCSLCRQPLETSRGIRICLDCDLAQITI